MVQRFDLEEIHRSISLLLQQGQTYELRCFGRGTTSGYFRDFGKLAGAAARLSGSTPGVYITLNPVSRDLFARSADRIKTWVKATTSDPQIVLRRWLPIDLDAKRPADISSTEEEHQAAIVRAIEVRAWLRSQGWPDPIYADSGNGSHLIYRVDLPNDQAATDLMMRCLRALSFRFDDEAVAVDRGNFNAARIWKIYGTMVGKGDNIPERPHRIARILDAPDGMEDVPLPNLQSLAVQSPTEPPASSRRSYRGNSEPFDLEKWLARHEIPIRHHGSWNGGQKWVLDRCLWNPEHTDKSAYIVRFPSGAIAAGCHHNSCQGQGWTELREAVEPGYRERPIQAVPRSRPGNMNLYRKVQR